MNNKSANRQMHKQSQHRLKPVYAAVLLAFAVQTAQANPTGENVVNGQASFATSGNTLTVTNTPRHHHQLARLLDQYERDHPLRPAKRLIRRS
jgi:hypothetical protein